VAWNRLVQSTLHNKERHLDTIAHLEREDDDTRMLARTRKCDARAMFMGRFGGAHKQQRPTCWSCTLSLLSFLFCAFSLEFLVDGVVIVVVVVIDRLPLLRLLPFFARAEAAGIVPAALVFHLLFLLLLCCLVD
jgi:hypothetical protein